MAPACKRKLFGCTEERKGRGTVRESEGGTKETSDVFSPAVRDLTFCLNFPRWPFPVHEQSDINRQVD